MPVEGPFATGAAAEEYQAAAEEELSPVLLAGIALVLDSIREAALSGPGIPDLDSWSPEVIDWAGWLAGTLVPDLRRIIDDVIGRGGDADSIDVTTITYLAQQHLDSVTSRLRDWPTEAWIEVRDELAYGLSRGDSTTRLRERVGDALDITAVTRDVEAQADALYDRIEAGVTPAQESALRARIRELYETSESDRRRWEWRADRIARTETAGAMNAGVDAWGAATGSRWRRQWWSSLDNRVRPTHRAAHGQVRRWGETFAVGDAELRYPGDPSGPPGEVINCRCSLLLLSESEASQ